MAFKILKQLQAAKSSDPSWAQRKVWVYKLDDNDIYFPMIQKQKLKLKN